MRSRSIWLFLFAMLLAGGAALLAYRMMTRLQQPQQAAAESNTAPVVVAAVKIPFTQKIEANQLKVVNWPKDLIPQGVFNDPAKVIGKVATQTIVPNEPVLDERVVEHLGGSTLSAFIERSKRAVSIRVNDVTGVGGFVFPGNQVDVIEAPQEGPSRLLLENIKVLAVDQEASPDKDKPGIVKAVTLQLSPEQAQTLVKAAQSNSLHLALRNPLDDNLVGRPQPPQATATPPAKETPPVKAQTVKPRRTLTIVRGDQVSIYELP